MFGVLSLSLVGSAPVGGIGSVWAFSRNIFFLWVFGFVLWMSERRVGKGWSWSWLCDAVTLWLLCSLVSTVLNYAVVQALCIGFILRRLISFDLSFLVC